MLSVCWLIHLTVISSQAVCQSTFQLEKIVSRFRQYSTHLFSIDGLSHWIWKFVLVLVQIAGSHGSLVDEIGV